jgi:hypothetical protein
VSGLFSKKSPDTFSWHDLNNPMGRRFLAELQTNGIFSGRIGFEEYNSLLKQGLAATAEQAEGLIRQAISLGPGGDLALAAWDAQNDGIISAALTFAKNKSQDLALGASLGVMLGVVSKRLNAPRSIPSLREQYLGRTPGKGSRTGRQVIERMETEGNLRWNASGGAEVRYVDPLTKAESWHPLNSTDMGHLHDAVKYWNETGRTLGPKHPDVRKWMLGPANYELQPSSINRSNGARLKDRYMPPLGDE